MIGSAVSPFQRQIAIDRIFMAEAKKRCFPFAADGASKKRWGKKFRKINTMFEIPFTNRIKQGGHRPTDHTFPPTRLERSP